MAFTNNNSDNGKKFVNAIQESPLRLDVCSVNRCEDQVIGFEFVAKGYQVNPQCCGNAIVNMCVPIEVLDPIPYDSIEFWATEDTCYKDWTIIKKNSPEIEIQRNSDDKVTGVLVRFSKTESCCYPLNMAYKLFAFDETGCKHSIATGLLVFK